MITDHWIDGGKLLLSYYTGDITGEELLAGSLHKSGDMRFDNVRYVLSDWTKANKVRVSTDEIKALVACLRPISKICPHAKMGSIVNPDPTGNALAAWYKFLADDLTWQIEIFTSVEQAEDWCELYRNFLRTKTC